MASRNTLSRPVKFVQIDGLVVLKIIKHCQEEGATDLVQGVLLGLVVEDRLEITNCFPFPRHNEEEDFEEVQYQMEMMRNLRNVNIDHLHVGWYQSTFFGSFISKTFLESQFQYQHSIEESVVLIYDPLRTTQGFLSLKAFRLTREMMDFYGQGDYTPESLKAAGISFEHMMEEIPIHIRNSHLINVLCCELEENLHEKQKFNFLDLATSSMLEKNLQQLMDCVDEVAMDANRYLNFQRQFQKQKIQRQQYLSKREQENKIRQANGQKPLMEEDINKLFKPLQAPSRLESLLQAGQINNFCSQIQDFATQSLGKLFMSESLQGKSDD